MDAEIHSINGKLSPNAILGMLLSKSDKLKNIAIVIEWEDDYAASDGRWAAAFSQGTTPEQAALFIHLLTAAFNNSFLTSVVPATRV